MDPEIREFFEDIEKYAKEIKNFVSEHTLESYSEDTKTRMAVERSFEIIGEALNRIKKLDPELLESIRDHRSIISFRNILAHAYDHIEDKIVWGIIQSDIDNLIEDISSLK